MLREIVIRPDPFDLAIARTDPTHRAERRDRRERARCRRCARDSSSPSATRARIAQYLSDLELLVIGHRTERIRADVAWHENLLEQLPRLLDDHHVRTREGHATPVTDTTAATAPARPAFEVDHQAPLARARGAHRSVSPWR